MNPEFVSWVKNGENDDFWARYITVHPEKLEEMNEAKATILAAESLPFFAIGDEDKNALWNIIENQVLNESRSDKEVPVTKKYSVFRLVAAASLVFITGLSAWLLFKPVESPAPVSIVPTLHESVATLKEWEEISNQQEQSLPVHLPDGSSVVLKSQSQIRYSTTRFGKEKREVFLSGEAFFEVVKNPEQPFIVYASELVTKVLGTSFTIRAYPKEKEVKVLVNSGKVSVYALNPAHEPTTKDFEQPAVVLTKNQQILFNRLDLTAENTLTTTPVNRKIAVPIQAFSFTYEDQLITDIFTEIEAAYGIEMVWDRHLMANCRLTGNISNENLYEKINLICQSFDATYKTVGNQIIISSSGCQ